MLSLLGLFIFLLPFALASSNSGEPEILLSAAYLASFLVFIAVWIITKGLPFKKLGTIKCPLLFIALLLLIGIVFSIKQTSSLGEICKYAVSLLLFLIVAPLPEEEKKRLTSTIVLSALFISFLAIYQYFFGFQLLLDYVGRTKITDPFVLEKIAQRRVFFPFPTPGILGGYLAMILPLALNSKKRIFLLIPLALALAFTQSLSAFLSLTIVATVFLLWKTRTSPKNSFVLLAFGMILGCLFVLRTDNPNRHLLPAFSLTARLEYWKETWQIILAHPLIGMGLGNFDLPSSRYAHNSFLQLWAEAGIAGIVSFLWLVIAVLKTSWKKISGSSERRQKISLLAGVWVFLIHNLMDFSFFLPAVSFIWWIMLGLLYCPKLQGEEKTSSESLAKI